MLRSRRGHGAQGSVHWLLDSHRLPRRRGQRTIIGDFDQQPSGEIHNPAQREVNDHLMMLEPLATLDWAEVSQEAIVAVAHASKPAVSELAEHVPNMHLPVDVSNLDDSESLHIPAKFRIPAPDQRAEHGAPNTHLGLTSTSANHVGAPCPAPRFAAI